MIQEDDLDCHLRSGWIPISRRLRRQEWRWHLRVIISVRLIRVQSGWIRALQSNCQAEAQWMPKAKGCYRKIEDCHTHIVRWIITPSRIEDCHERSANAIQNCLLDCIPECVLPEGSRCRKSQRCLLPLLRPRNSLAWELSCEDEGCQVGFNPSGFDKWGNYSWVYDWRGCRVVMIIRVIRAIN